MNRRWGEPVIGRTGETAILQFAVSQKDAVKWRTQKGEFEIRN